MTAHARSTAYRDAFYQHLLKQDATIKEMVDAFRVAPEYATLIVQELRDSGKVRVTGQRGRAPTYAGVVIDSRAPNPFDRPSPQREAIARALADHERLGVKWRTYEPAAAAVLIALDQSGFVVTPKSTRG